MAFWNAMMSIKAVTGLPVNLIFLAEEDEERIAIGYRKFIRDNPELFSEAGASCGAALRRAVSSLS